MNYANKRIVAGDFEPFNAFVHYDVNGFWKAVAAKDNTFNFMGSFTVKVKPNKEEKYIEYSVINTSGLESATRFRRDPNSPPGKVNKIGIFEDKKRGEKGLPKIGGNLSCRWQWQIPFNEQTTSQNENNQ